MDSSDSDEGGLAPGTAPAVVQAPAPALEPVPAPALAPEPAAVPAPSQELAQFLAQGPPPPRPQVIVIAVDFRVEGRAMARVISVYAPGGPVAVTTLSAAEWPGIFVENLNRLLPGWETAQLVFTASVPLLLYGLLPRPILIENLARDLEPDAPGVATRMQIVGA